jgi:menaquinone-dependent protoporphyrinogen oxidase
MRAAVFFATREGQARRVAERVAADLRAQRAQVDVFDVKALSSRVDWTRYHFACIVASVHGGHHEREMVRFAILNRGELRRLHATFLSLTLSEAGAEDRSKPPADRQRSAADAERMIQVFIDETGWRPARTLAVAGALAYSKYNFFIRFVMKRIARKAGAPTDTSLDYEFTDWAAVDRFVSDSVAARRKAGRSSPHSSERGTPFAIVSTQRGAP